MDLQFVWLTAISTAFYALTWWSTGWGFSPDGAQYERMAFGANVPMPYARRALLPWLMGLRIWDRWPAWPLRRRWFWFGAVCTVLSAVLTAYYAAESFEHRVLAIVLFVGLPGIWRLNVWLPMLVDPAAYCLALGSALCARNHHYIPAFLLSSVGLATKESVPLFAAILSFNPIPLVAFLHPVLFFRVWKGGSKVDRDPKEPYLKNPVREARKVHDFFDWRLKLLPWGAVGVLAAIGAGRNFLTYIAAAALTLAYGQLFVAMDNARLYQWAAPAMIALALAHPPSWVWIAAIVGLFNPYRGI